MTIDSNHEQFIGNITEALDKSVENFDAALLSRLAEIRALALTRPVQTSNSDESLDSLVMAARVALDESTEAIEPELNQRLNQVRKMALNQPREIQPENSDSGTLNLVGQIRRLFENRRITIPASGFATACVMVTVIALFYQVPDPDSLQLSSEEIMLFASTDEIELYENLEFYQWLADTGLPD